MLVFSLAGAPLSVSHDATRAVNLLYSRSLRRYDVYLSGRRPKFMTNCTILILKYCWFSKCAVEPRRAYIFGAEIFTAPN